MKLRELIVEFSAQFERQETGIINAVNSALKKSKSITIQAGETTLGNITGIGKKPLTSELGHEPLTDVVLIQNGKNINISAKGERAPSLAGGGGAGINELIPGLMEKVLNKTNAIVKNLIANGKYKEGQIDDLPSFFYKLTPAESVKLFIGDEKTGGPIHFMYIGPMDVKSTFQNNILTLNGSLIDAIEKGKHGTYYIRIRRERNDQPFDTELKNAMGMPNIFGRSAYKGTARTKITVVDKPYENGIIVK